ncbi:hypothetical protein E2C01_047123 [Portunus trituberculatus]|uniref:Uncharacterized protein n=1 Tax=Portunus trituberculatus TaxID=210409 RepID=A0A5B7G9L5_PORTR|nr:hypothetical protein [Portunus trituberculatus]
MYKGLTYKNATKKKKIDKSDEKRNALLVDWSEVGHCRWTFRLACLNVNRLIKHRDKDELRVKAWCVVVFVLWSASRYISIRQCYSPFTWLIPAQYDFISPPPVAEAVRRCCSPAHANTADLLTHSLPLTI